MITLKDDNKSGYYSARISYKIDCNKYMFVVREFYEDLNLYLENRFGSDRVFFDKHGDLGCYTDISYIEGNHVYTTISPRYLLLRDEKDCKVLNQFFEDLDLDFVYSLPELAETIKPSLFTKLKNYFNGLR